MKAKNNKTSKNQSTKKKNIVEIYETEHKKPHGNKNFTDPKQVETLINQYFNDIDNNPIYKKDFIKSGDMAGQIVDIPVQQPYTIEGLCLHLKIKFDTFETYINDENQQIAELFYNARVKIRQQQISYGLVNCYNSNLVARLNGLSDNSNVSGNIEHKVTKIIFE